MAKTQVLEYKIHLTDKALVDKLNAELDAGGGPTINPHAGNGILVATGHQNGLLTAPHNPGAGGASDIGAALLGVAGPLPVLSGSDAFTSPSLTSPWFGHEGNFPLDVATFTRKSGGWFGIPALFGSTTKFYWSGRFVYSPAEDVDDPETGEPITDPAPIPQRRWIIGGDLSRLFFPQDRHGPFSSEYAGTRGIGMRRPSTAAVTAFTHWFIGGTTADRPSKSWERIIITPRSLPTGEVAFWRAHSGANAFVGVEVRVLPSGQLAFYTRDTSNNAFLAGTGGQLVVGETTILDFLLNFHEDSPGSNDSIALRAFQQRTQIGSATFIGATGVAANAHAHSVMHGSPGNDNTWEYDLLLWRNAAIPEKDGVESLTSDDWLLGARTFLAMPESFDSDHGGWSGDIRRLGQVAGGLGEALTSTTAQAVASVVTTGPNLHEIPGARGIAGICVGLYSHRGTNPGQIGLNVNGDGEYYVQLLSEAASPNPGWNLWLHNPAGLAKPLELTSLSLKYRKGNDTSEAGLYILGAICEVIGVFGPGDVDPDDAAAVGAKPRLGMHNAAYPGTPWAELASPVFGALAIKSGTFTGNAGGQDIDVPLPPCIVIARRVAASFAGTVMWMPSMLAAHASGELGLTPEAVRAEMDRAFVPAGTEDSREVQAIIRIAGSDPRINENGQRYWYLAIMDPAARFFLNHALAHHGSFAGLPKTDALPNPNFTPEFALIQGETEGNISTTALYFRGPGHAARAATKIGGGETANIAALAAGGLITDAGLHNVSDLHSIAALLGRTDDGGGPYAIPPFAVVSWTGDGSGGRTVGVNLGGKRPLFAMAFGGNNQFTRDPQHTGANSSTFLAGGNSTTGITGGGIDSVSMGSSLNASGVLYHMLVIPGSATSNGQNGWSVDTVDAPEAGPDGALYPIEPDSETPDDWTEPTIIDPNDDGGEGPGEADPENPDLDPSTPLPGTSLFCEDFTRQLCNIALQRIGVSKTITDLNTDMSEPAVLARGFIRHEVEATLRDFEWNFATGYADLTLVAGTPSTKAVPDFQYAYREPADSLYVRRIVGQKDQRRGFDPNPIRFRRNTQEGASGGGLIYTDAEATADTPVQIEYTRRVSCPAYFGDALFRDALCWRFAHAFAPALAKDPRKTAYAWEQYLAALQAAEVGAGNEEQEHRSSGEDPDWIRARN